MPEAHSGTAHVIGASALGTLLEWYDFFLYGALAGYIASHFFSGIDPTSAFILALATFAVGFAMTGLNVYTWLWWFTAVPSIAGTVTDHPRRDLPMICIGVGVAALCWVVCFASVLSVVRHFAGRTFHMVADVVGGTMLLGFGLWALWTAVSRPL